MIRNIFLEEMLDSFSQKFSDDELYFQLPKTKKEKLAEMRLRAFCPEDPVHIKFFHRAVRKAYEEMDNFDPREELATPPKLILEGIIKEDWERTGIGICSYQLFHSQAYLQFLFTDNQRRGKGYGQALAMTMILNEVHNHAVDVFQSCCSQNLVRYYELLGFESVQSGMVIPNCPEDSVVSLEADDHHLVYFILKMDKLLDKNHKLLTSNQRISLEEYRDQYFLHFSR